MLRLPRLACKPCCFLEASTYLRREATTTGKRLRFQAGPSAQWSTRCCLHCPSTLHAGMLWLTQASPGCSRPPAVMLDPTCWCDLPRHPQGNAAVQHTSQCLAAGCHSHGAAEGLHRVCPHAVSAWHHKHSHLASRHCMAAMACQLSWACMPVYVGSAGVIVLCNRAWHVCRLQGEQGRGHRRCHF